MFGRSLRAVLAWFRSSQSWQSEAVSLLSRLASSSRASPTASTIWGLSSVFSSGRALLSSLGTWGSGHMNLIMPWWVKPLLMVLALAGAFGAGVVYEARTELQTVLAQSRKEREALALALTSKMEAMQTAAVESAKERTAREASLAEENQKLIEEAQSDVKDNRSCLPADAAAALDRLRNSAAPSKPKQRSLLAPFRSHGAGNGS
jgi:hypothetical protein